MSVCLMKADKLSLFLRNIQFAKIARPWVVHMKRGGISVIRTPPGQRTVPQLPRGLPFQFPDAGKTTPRGRSVFLRGRWRKTPSSIVKTAANFPKMIHADDNPAKARPTVEPRSLKEDGR